MDYENGLGEINRGCLHIETDNASAIEGWFVLRERHPRRPEALPGVIERVDAYGGLELLPPVAVHRDVEVREIDGRIQRFRRDPRCLHMLGQLVISIRGEALTCVQLPPVLKSKTVRQVSIPSTRLPIVVLDSVTQTGGDVLGDEFSVEVRLEISPNGEELSARVQCYASNPEAGGGRTIGHSPDTAGFVLHTADADSCIVGVRGPTFDGLRIVGKNAEAEMPLKATHRLGLVTAGTVTDRFVEGTYLYTRSGLVARYGVVGGVLDHSALSGTSIEVDLSPLVIDIGSREW